MEKHFVLVSSVLEKWQEELLDEFKTWICKYSSPRLELNHCITLIILRTMITVFSGLCHNFFLCAHCISC